MSIQNNSNNQIIYSPEFREQAVRLHKVDGLTVPEISKRLSIPDGTLKKWITAYPQKKLAEVGKHQKPLTDLEYELARVKCELAEVKMEREILKKAVACIAKTSRCSMVE